MLLVCCWYVVLPLIRLCPYFLTLLPCMIVPPTASLFTQYVPYNMSNSTLLQQYYFLPIMYFQYFYWFLISSGPSNFHLIWWLDLIYTVHILAFPEDDPWIYRETSNYTVLSTFISDQQRSLNKQNSLLR